MFIKLGMLKNLAKTLLYISQFDECKGADVEQATDMRQPEVSVVMQELRRRGWVKKREKEDQFIFTQRQSSFPKW